MNLSGSINKVRKVYRDNFFTRLIQAFVFPMLEFFHFWDQNADPDTYSMPPHKLDSYFIDRPHRTYPKYMIDMFNMLRYSGNVVYFGHILSISTFITLYKTDIQLMLKDDFLGDNVVGNWKANRFHDIPPIADLSLLAELVPGFKLYRYDINSTPDRLFSLGNCFLSPDSKGADTFVYSLRNTPIDDTDRAFSLIYTIRANYTGIIDITDAFSELYQRSVLIGKSFIWNGRPLTGLDNNDVVYSDSRGYVSYGVVTLVSEILFGVGETTAIPSQGMGGGNSNSQGNRPRKREYDITRERSLDIQSDNITETLYAKQKTLPPSNLGRRGGPKGVKSHEIKDFTNLELESEFLNLKTNENTLANNANLLVSGVNNLGGVLKTAISYASSGQTAQLMSLLNTGISIYSSLRENSQNTYNTINNVQQNTLSLEASLNQRLGINM